MTRGRTLYLPALIVASVLMACAAAVLAVSREAEATFPGKNGKIAYVGFRLTNGATEIYTINPGRGGKTQITHSYNATEFSPSYSPNGKKIAYMAPEGRDGSGSEIYTINAGGGGKIQLTHNNTEDYEPSYSPDGKKIVYVSGGSANATELYTIDVGGGGKTDLTNTDNVDEYMPSWGSRP
jgi:Tol biopolymer transport system component